MLGLRHASVAPLELVPTAPLFPSVLAGIDFGPASLAAARWAFSHVARDAHAILSHVATASERVPDADAGLSPGRALKQLAPALTGGLGGFAATLRIASTRTAVRLGRPSSWLRSLAAEMDASLVVLGRRSNANRRRIGEPNVIERVTRTTPAAVLVVPEGVNEPPRYIIAAIDRSAVATHIVATAKALADLFAYRVVVLHVVTPIDGEYPRVLSGARQGRAQHHPVDQALPDGQAMTKRMLRRRAKRDATDAPDGQWSSRIARGDPAREIMAEAHRLGGAMIVVGKRGEDQSPIGSVGSVARELLASSPVPVLAVHDDSGPPGKFW